MPAEKNLNLLIKNLKPHLHKGRFVFVTLQKIPEIPADEIICLFREDEGISLVLKQTTADNYKLPFSFVASWITLKVHSSLEAVGLTARVSDALAKANISCNAIAAYHHDHIFVPYRDAENAMSILRKLSIN